MLSLFTRKKEKPEWGDYYSGHIKGWQCNKLLEYPNLLHLFTSKYHDFNLGKHAPTIFPEKSVEKNRELLCKTFNLNYKNLLTLPLKHTNNVLILDENDPEISDCDAVITKFTNVPILITAADCVPIILYSDEKKVLGLIHAGWKGTAGKIVEKTVSAMLENYMVRPSQIIAAIGPAIGQKHYEVDEDVAKQIIDATESEDILNKTGKKPRIDLKLANKIQLENMGVGEIYMSELDTASDRNLFYSHRIQGKRAGRQGLVACLV